MPLVNSLTNKGSGIYLNSGTTTLNSVWTELDSVASSNSVTLSKMSSGVGVINLGSGNSTVNLALSGTWNLDVWSTVNLGTTSTNVWANLVDTKLRNVSVISNGTIQRITTGSGNDIVAYKAVLNDNETLSMGVGADTVNLLTTTTDWSYVKNANGTTSATDLLSHKTLLIGTDVENLQIDGALNINLKSLVSGDHGDTGPVLSNVLTSVSTGGFETATSNKSGNIFLVDSVGPNSGHSSLADLQADVNAGHGVFATVTANVQSSISTGSLAAGSYKAYAVDAVGVISDGVDVTLVQSGPTIIQLSQGVQTQTLTGNNAVAIGDYFTSAWGQSPAFTAVADVIGWDSTDKIILVNNGMWGPPSDPLTNSSLQNMSAAHVSILNAAPGTNPADSQSVLSMGFGPSTGYGGVIEFAYNESAGLLESAGTAATGTEFINTVNPNIIVHSNLSMQTGHGIVLEAGAPGFANSYNGFLIAFDTNNATQKLDAFIFQTSDLGMDDGIALANNIHLVGIVRGVGTDLASAQAALAPSAFLTH